MGDAKSAKEDFKSAIEISPDSHQVYFSRGLFRFDLKMYKEATADLRKALAAFAGVRRRFDRIGEVAGVMVLDDYGHHPTEVRVTLKAVRKDFPSRRLVCVFQPHQCSRTRIFLKEFAQSLTTADCVIVPDIYSVRDTVADQREPIRIG